jgi:hypothetical protein
MISKINFKSWGIILSLFISLSHAPESRGAVFECLSNLKQAMARSYFLGNFFTDTDGFEIEIIDGHDKFMHPYLLSVRIQNQIYFEQDYTLPKEKYFKSVLRVKKFVKKDVSDAMTEGYDIQFRDIISQKAYLIQVRYKFGKQHASLFVHDGTNWIQQKTLDQHQFQLSVKVNDPLPDNPEEIQTKKSKRP